MAKTKKELTNNDLVVEMRSGFSNLEKKIGNLEKKVEKKLDQKIGQLAEITRRGFEEADKNFERHDNMFKLVFDRFDKVESDIHDIKTNLSPLISSEVKQDQKIKRLDLRLRQVEKEVGIREIGA